MLPERILQLTPPLDLLLGARTEHRVPPARGRTGAASPPCAPSGAARQPPDRLPPLRRGRARAASAPSGPPSSPACAHVGRGRRPRSENGGSDRQPATTSRSSAARPIVNASATASPGRLDLPLELGREIHLGAPARSARVVHGPETFGEHLKVAHAAEEHAPPAQLLREGLAGILVVDASEGAQRRTQATDGDPDRMHRSASRPSRCRPSARGSRRTARRHSAARAPRGCPAHRAPRSSR